ncbi:MAG: hypothetical protein IT561_04400 [Alphaproteobacteria bacterium]|nr:hypothetical protein [Alphaproteobacteria bacterium]
MTTGGPRSALEGVGLLAIGLLLVQIGLVLPDIDQRIPFIGHRSALTHSVLLPLLLAGRWPAIAGLLAGGIAVHLGADLLPRGWFGYALVRVPFLGPLDATLSQLFLAANAVVGLHLFHAASREPATRRMLWAMLAVSAAAYLLVHERWWPLVLAAVALATVVVVWRRR